LATPDGSVALPSASPGSSPADPGATPDVAVMSLVEHLTELRRRLAISVLAVVVGSAIGFYFTPRVLTLLKAPVEGPLIFLEPGGAFFLQMQTALMIGIGLALPVILYQFWAFVSPGLTARERRLARPWIPIAILLFVLGMVLAYFVLPFAVGFLLGFQIVGVLEDQLTADGYYGWVTFLFLVFGIVMEFPIVLVLLNRMGILSVERLRRSRRYVLLGVVIFAVVITPGGDPVSPMVMTAVMFVLYELTIRVLDRMSTAESA